MSKRSIQKSLKKALLEGGEFVQALFEYELEEHLEEYILSRKEDHDDYFFAITEIDGDVAMLFINEQDRVYTTKMLVSS